MNQKLFLGAWRKWYSQRTGLDEKAIMINGRHGKAVKELIKHIEQAHPETEPIEVFEAVLNNWDRLEPFYQKNFMEVWSIYQHWNNIINKIKNGDNNQQVSDYLQSLQ